MNIQKKYKALAEANMRLGQLRNLLENCKWSLLEKDEQDAASKQLRDIELRVQAVLRDELLHIQSTPTLLNWLNHSRVFNGRYNPLEEWNGDGSYTSEEIKAELATREHIMNRGEGKSFRRKAAKIKKAR